MTNDSDDRRDKPVIPVDPDKFLGSPPEAHTKSYKNLSEVPADVLASRLVGSLIACEGNLNQYKHVITKFIRETRADSIDAAMKDFGPGAWVPIEALFQTQRWLREVLDIANSSQNKLDRSVEKKQERLDYIGGRLAEREKADAEWIAELAIRERNKP